MSDMSDELTVDDLEELEGIGDAGSDDLDQIAYFEGDAGSLDLAQRRAMVTLLKHRFITATSHAKVWDTIVADPDRIRAHLNNLFLDLHLDTARQVAFKVQAGASSDQFPTLLYNTPWPREETVLMVYLRTRARTAANAGQVTTYVDRADIREHLASMRPPSDSDNVRGTRSADRAISALHRAGLLLGKVDADTFEVSRAIDVVLPLERLQQLSTWLASSIPDVESDTTGAPTTDDQPRDEESQR